MVEPCRTPDSSETLPLSFIWLFSALAFIETGFVIYWELVFLRNIDPHNGYAFTAESVPLSDEPPQRFPFLLNESSKCSIREPFLVLLIPSRPEDNATRDAIRTTWGNESLMPGIAVVRLFLLGIPSSHNASVRSALLWESATFRDIIQQDFLDTYNNLTLKTMMGMEWVARYCPNAKYIMKIDSDMFFNPELLVHRLLKPSQEVQKNYVTGLVVYKGLPERKKTSKWYLSREVYRANIFPTYCSGTGYVLSGDVATQIFNISYLLKPLFIEDVFVGLCLAKLRIRISRPPPYLFNGEYIRYNRCRFAKLITVHQFTTEELVQIWPDFMKAKRTC